MTEPAGRPNVPDDEPPRERGGPLAWVAGTIPGLVAVGFTVIVIVVILIVLL
jgi:hypothetical protein